MPVVPFRNWIATQPVGPCRYATSALPSPLKSPNPTTLQLVSNTLSTVAPPVCVVPSTYSIVSAPLPGLRYRMSPTPLPSKSATPTGTSPYVVATWKLIQPPPMPVVPSCNCTTRLPSEYWYRISAVELLTAKLPPPDLRTRPKASVYLIWYS